MIEVGRICVKIAGRDAGKKAVVTDVLDKNYVMIDGEVRRKKCNIMHLEPLKETVKIKKGASAEEVKKALKEIGIELISTKPKSKTEKPKKKRASVPSKEDKKEKVEKK